jgi:hypothetical protein
VCTCLGKPEYSTPETVINASFTENPAVSGLVLSTEDPGGGTALGRNFFKNASFLRPHNFVPGLSHPEKEVGIFGSRQCKSVIELWYSSENVGPDEYIVGCTDPALRTGGGNALVKKTSTLDPLRHVRSIFGQHRAAHDVRRELGLRPKKLVQPVSRRNLIVINESYKIYRSSLVNCSVSYVTNAAPWFDDVPEWPGNGDCLAGFLGAREFVVIHDHYLYFRRLYFAKHQLGNSVEQIAKQFLPLESADTNRYSHVAVAASWHIRNRSRLVG